MSFSDTQWRRIDIGSSIASDWLHKHVWLNIKEVLAWIAMAILFTCISPWFLVGWIIGYHKEKQEARKDGIQTVKM